ncbi:MAG: ATP-binding protein [Polyangiales bacterium]
MSLLSRIAPAIAFLVVCCVAVTGVMLLRASDERRADRVEDIQSAIVVAQTRFEDEVGEVVRSTRLLQHLPAVDGLVRARRNGGVDPLDGSTETQWSDRLALVFAEMLRSHGTYLQARFVGIADGGRELVRVERASGEEDIRRVSERDLQEKESERYFATAIAVQEGDISVSPVDLNREHGQIAEPHVPVFRISAPVFEPRDDSAAVVGFVVINVDARVILDNLAAAFPNDTTYVMRGDGHFVLHPEPSRAFGFDLGQSPTALADFPTLASFIRGEQDATHQSDEDQLLGAGRLTSGGTEEESVLTLVVTSDADELGGYWEVIPPLAAFAAMAIVLGLLLAFLVTRPFRDLARAVTAMETDDRTLDVPEGLTGEAKQLAEVLERSIAALRANDRIQASNHELRQFAYLASHDLREPIRTIASYSGLLEEEYAELYDEDGRTFLKFIGRSCERMNALIDGLLAHSQLGNDAIAEVVDMKKLALEVVEDLNASIREGDAKVHIADTLPTLRLYPLEVRLLFQNLLSNALKFGREGVPVEVHVDAKHTEDEWTFSIADNGQGIPVKHRERIFGVFQRLHNRSEHPGSGIGLAHCQKIVRLHHGRIWLEDAPGGGTVFFFTLRERPAA